MPRSSGTDHCIKKFNAYYLKASTFEPRKYKRPALAGMTRAGRLRNELVHEELLGDCDCDLGCLGLWLLHFGSLLWRDFDAN